MPLNHAKVQSSPASRVHVPCTFTVRCCLRSRTGLTANLQGFRIGVPERDDTSFNAQASTGHAVASVQVVFGMSGWTDASVLKIETTGSHEWPRSLLCSRLSKKPNLASSPAKSSVVPGAGEAPHGPTAGRRNRAELRQQRMGRSRWPQVQRLTHPARDIRYRPYRAEHDQTAQPLRRHSEAAWKVERSEPLPRPAIGRPRHRIEGRDRKC